MFAVQAVARRAPQLKNLAEAQRRTIVSGPPTVKVSKAEKMFHGWVLYVGIMAVPMYITSQLKTYREAKGSG